MNHTTPNNTLFGTLGGTVLSIFAIVDIQDVLKTIVLAAIGAVVSFLVSYLLKLIMSKK
ncbi:hypothetical protein SAMN05216474_0791 [Lishizhenia tianjinensis]|uniref:Uncharacterized protein n=1 Tax=Lishizhenia tianjinensis TaxID=477690 RepID=A0A1I6YC30_9FLAO|nr:hypothetical protein SAMN05216474_0791 [Lishizhenia tianjinensis]